MRVTLFLAPLVTLGYISLAHEVAISYKPCMKQVTYHTPALKALRKMPANTARRIVAKIDAYAADPDSQANNVKALKGTDAIRLRVGDSRVVIDAEVIDVIRIAARGSVYSERKVP